MLKLGGLGVSNIKKGNTNIKKVYNGSTLLWQSPFPDTPPPTGQLTINRVATEEFVGPFASWITMTGGDGSTDCTPILQTICNELKNGANYTTVYFPAGTYRFTGQVNGVQLADAQFVGEHPDTVKFVWDGPAGGTFFFFNSIQYSSMKRITFDGRSIAKAAINQSLNPNTASGFDTGNEYSDLVFKDLQFGIMGGQTGHGFAETAIVRCVFTNCTTAGITLGDFNALDCWIWDCVFTNCEIGVTNLYGSYNGLGAGNFSLFNCVFTGSKNADIRSRHTTQCEFSFRDNTSVGSNRFLYMEQTNWGAQTVVQANTIIDCATTPIEVRNQGTVTLLDNTIRYDGVCVVGACETGTDIVCLGNTYSSTNAVQTNGRLIQFDNGAESNIAIPIVSLSAVPLRMNRTVFDLPAGSSASQIQDAITQASALHNKAIVHLAYGSYGGNFTIPANSDITLCGDSAGDNKPTRIQNGGSGPTLTIQGPSTAVVRDLAFYGGEGIRIENVDQPGSRIFMHQQICRWQQQEGLTVEGLQHCKVIARNCEWEGTQTGVVVSNATVVLVGGLMWANTACATVNQNGSLLIRDVWYESNDTSFSPFVFSGSGTLSIDASRIINKQEDQSRTATFNNFNGKVALIGNGYMAKIDVLGTTPTKVLSLGNMINMYNSDSSFINNNASADVREHNLRNATDGANDIGSVIRPNQGVIESAFLNDMLAHIRNVHADLMTPTPSGTTDIKIYRVWATQGVKGIWIK